jgi:hypothetical protein
MARAYVAPEFVAALGQTGASNALLNYDFALISLAAPVTNVNALPLMEPPAQGNQTRVHACLSLHLSVYLPVHLPTCLPAFASVRLPACLPACLCIFPSACTSVQGRSVNASVCPSVYLLATIS